MCGRFSLSQTADEIMDVFEASHWDQEALYTPSFNIAPSQYAPVLRATAEGVALAAMHWGLIPHWAKERSIGYRMINARIETIREKAAYRSLVRNNRCVVPAEGYYEWQRCGARKVPFFIQGPDPLMCFAGLWSVWRGPSGDIWSFSIVTRPPVEDISCVHDRMPAVLTEEQRARWLAEPMGGDELIDELRTCAVPGLQCYAVSSYVNKPGNGGPRCMAPVDSANQPELF